MRVLIAYPIRLEPTEDEQEYFRIARRYRLSFHDAAYLSLAARHRVPLATLDRALRSAALSAEITASSLAASFLAGRSSRFLLPGRRCTISGGATSIHAAAFSLLLHSDHAAKISSSKPGRIHQRSAACIAVRIPPAAPVHEGHKAPALSHGEPVFDLVRRFSFDVFRRPPQPDRSLGREFLLDAGSATGAHRARGSQVQAIILPCDRIRRRKAASRWPRSHRIPTA